MRFPYVVLLSACALMLCLPLLAQSPNGVLNGQVVDPTNGAIVAADVVAMNDVTGVRYTTRTNGEGIYVLRNIPPGPYRLQVSKFGFKTIIKPDIMVHVQDALALNFTLPVGATAEVVTVTGGAPLVNTDNAAVSTVIDRNFVDQLPVNGRSFNTLLQLTPGVVITGAPFGVASSPGQFSIAGQRTNANSFSVDGVSANFGVGPTANIGSSGAGSAQAFSALGGTSSLVSVDDLEEFRVETSSFAPEFGRSPGGQVILTTRSGTNDFHGGLFEYFRNDVLDANDWFANQAGKPRAPERHNDFGGFGGGPIFKDKTFFFLSYEGARLRVPQTSVIPVPSEFARTTAPAELIPYLTTYPQPDDRSVTPGVFTSPFTGVYSNQATLNASSVRVDHKFGDKLSIFGRYNYAPSETVTRLGSLSDVETLTANTQTLTLGVNMFLSPTVTNMFRSNYSTQSAGTIDALDTFGGAIPIDPALLLGSLPLAGNSAFLQIGDTTNFDVGLGARNRSRQFNFVDDLAVSRGTHQLQFGGDYRAIFLDTTPSHNTPNYLIDSVQDFISPGTAGVVPNFSTATSLPARILAQTLSLYGQDTWKVGPRLTLTYGVRWEFAPAPSGRGATKLASWANTNDFSSLALAPIGTPIWNTTYSNFAPRVGVAYSLTEQNDFVIRAGFGLFYDTAAGQVGSVAISYPNSAFAFPPPITLPLPDLTPYLPTISLDPPYPSAQGFVNDLRLPCSYQWNVALEKAFRGRQVVSATWVGQAGRNLLRVEGLLQPNSNFSNFLSLTGNTAWSNYDALQLQYRRPLSGRLQALVGYTWSHSLDNVSDDGLQSTSHTVISGARDYANSSFDVRHSFSAAATFLLPSAAKSGVLSAVSRDWSINGVVVARSGFSFNAIALGGGPGGIALRRPDLIAGQPLWIPDATAGGGRSVNPAAFIFPPAGRQGSEPRNDIPGFGLVQADLSIGRKFALRDHFNLQFRAEAFNALNHPNFTNPKALFFPFGGILLSSTQMLNGGLGGLNALFQQGGPRSLQLSLRLTF
jgi:hypothetical protein